MKDKVIEKLNSSFKDDIVEISEFRGELTIVVKKEKIVDIKNYKKHRNKIKFNREPVSRSSYWFHPTLIS